VSVSDVVVVVLGVLLNIVVLFFLVAAVVLRLKARRELVQLQLRLASLGLTTIDRAGEGPIAVEGQARGLELLSAPFSGTRVIAFRVRLQAVEDYGEHRVWCDLLEATGAEDFEVDDGTGRALVRAEATLLLLAQETRGWQRADHGPAREAAQRLLQAQGRSVPERLRFVEHLLEPGEPVFVVGGARRQAAESVPALVIEGPEPGEPVLIADRRQKDLARRLKRGEVPS